MIPCKPPLLLHDRSYRGGLQGRSPSKNPAMLGIASTLEMIVRLDGAGVLGRALTKALFQGVAWCVKIDWP